MGPITAFGKLLTRIVCLCHQAVQSGTGLWAVELFGREGNRRPVGKLWQSACLPPGIDGLGDVRLDESGFGFRDYIRDVRV